MCQQHKVCKEQKVRGPGNKTRRVEGMARKEFPGNDKLWFVVSLVFVFPFQEERKLLFSLNYGSIHSLLSQILTVRTGLIPRLHSLGMRLGYVERNKFEQGYVHVFFFQWVKLILQVSLNSLFSCM